MSAQGPSLELLGDGRRWPLGDGQVLTIGRDVRCEIRIDHPEVSRRHAEVVHDPQHGWVLRDVGSANGTYADGRRVQGVTLAPELLIGLGPSPQAPRLVVRPARAAADSTLVAGAQTRPVTIGRGDDNTVVVTDLLVSRHHARATSRPDGFWIEDLGSLNGTHVNGRAITQALLRPGDRLTIGHLDFRIEDGELRMAPQSTEISLVASDLRVVLPSGKAILGGVDFALPARSLLAVIGPSGAGKSTLLGALTGSRKATSGHVSFDGRDLYDNFHELRHRIGLVPQDDVVHRRLTVRQALDYASELRFPADLDAAARRGRVSEVIAELGLDDHAHTRIDRLSGGQRKRTSVALELLTQPSLLFLDEPTSGLDPGLDKSVMTMLRRLADDGRTVVTVTHSVANLDLCDRVLLLAPGGTVAYFGPPEGVLSHFGRTDYSDVFSDVTAHPVEVTAAFRQSVTAAPQISEPGATRPSQPAAPPLRQQPVRRQAFTLTRRHWRVLAADRSYAAFMALLPAVLALLVMAVPGDAGFGPAASPPTSEPLQLLVVLVVGASFMGMASSARDLVGERVIYRREKGVGLSPLAYLVAKLIVFGALAATQSAVLVGLVLLAKAPPDTSVALPNGPLELYLAVAATAYCSAAFGLLISSLVSTSEQVMPLLVITIMAQLVLCGGLIPVHDQAGLEQLAWAAPSRWGYAAGASGIDALTRVPTASDPLWEHTAANWWRCMAMLAGLTSVAVAVTGVRLRRVGAQR